VEVTATISSTKIPNSEISGVAGVGEGDELGEYVGVAVGFDVPEELDPSEDEGFGVGFGVGVSATAVTEIVCNASTFVKV